MAFCFFIALFSFEYLFLCGSQILWARSPLPAEDKNCSRFYKVYISVESRPESWHVSWQTTLIYNWLTPLVTIQDDCSPSCFVHYVALQFCSQRAKLHIHSVAISGFKNSFLYITGTSLAGTSLVITSLLVHHFNRQDVCWQISREEEQFLGIWSCKDVINLVM